MKNYQQYPWETNPITDDVQRTREAIEEEVDLTDDRLERITRLRLVSDAGFPLWDVSYCYGELKDGTPVRVSLPEHQFPKKKLKYHLVVMCKRHGLYAKGLGILDDSVISKLW